MEILILEKTIFIMRQGPVLYSLYNTNMHDVSQIFTGITKIKPTSSTQSDSLLNSLLRQIRVSALKTSQFFYTIANHSLSSANDVHCVLRETLSCF